MPGRMLLRRGVVGGKAQGAVRGQGEHLLDAGAGIVP